MVSNLFKRVGFVGLALLMLSTAAMNIFVFGNTVRAEGSLSSWTDAKGNAVTKLNEVDWKLRIKFLSGQQILDTSTKTIYSTIGEIYGDSENLIKNGSSGKNWIYSPTDAAGNQIISTNNKCYGVFLLHASGDGQDGKLQVVQPQISGDGTSCTIGPASGKLPIGEANPNENQKLSIINDGNWNPDWHGISDWIVAPFYWQSKDTMGYYPDSSVAITKYTPGSPEDESLKGWTASQLKASPGSTGFTFWKIGSCTFEVLATENFGGKVAAYGKIFNFGFNPLDSAPNGDEITITTVVGIGECAKSPGSDSYDQFNYKSSPNEASGLVPIAFYDLINNPATLPPIVSPITNVGEDTNDPAAQECEDLAGNFGVIACEILKGVDGFLKDIEDIIAGQLEVKADLYSAEGNGKGVYEAWRSVARISSALIAIISLVMVLGTALGDYKAFSPYTVKRVLPRLVIAAIAIWLSWPLATAYINLMNILGKGIADILWSPFVAGAGDFNSYGLANAMGDKSNVSKALTSSFLVVGALATAGFAASGGVFALISSLIPILIFMLVGFAVLVLRQALIIFLLVLAPVAIVAWVLPNTESIWKKWSKLFNQLLIMFPMFMGILAAGKIFSYINSKSDGGNDFFNIIISVIGYVTPFVLLPGIFKSAGGALSKVTGALNKQGSKYGGKLSGVTDNQAKIRKNAITSNNRLNALQNIGKPDRGVVGGFMDRRRVGMPIGVGFRSGSRDALSKQRERIGAAGKEEYKKAQRELVDNELKTLRENNTDRASLTDIVQNGDSTQKRQAALERLIETRAETEVRGLMNGGHAKEEFNKVINDGTLRSAFSDTAPDIGRAIVDTDGSIKTNDMLTAGKLPDASTIAGWTKTTLGVALEDDGNKQTILDMVERNPDFAESLNQEKLDEINKAVYRLSGGVLDPDGKVPPGTPQLFTPARQQKA